MLDIASGWMDYGYHLRRRCIPAAVPGALMIEPTETESKETLDEFGRRPFSIAHEAATTPDPGERAASHGDASSGRDACRPQPRLRWLPAYPTGQHRLDAATAFVR